MRLRMLRIVALAVCLVASQGWMVTANADTTETISVTGEVIGTVLTMTLSANTFAFGQIDATGYAYDPANSTAQPFAVGENLYGFPLGNAWFSRQPVIMTLTNPVEAEVRACLTAHVNVVDTTTSRLYLASDTPAFVGTDPVDILPGKSVPLCDTGNAVTVAYDPGMAVAYGLYPAFLVPAGSSLGSFSATIRLTFSVL